MRRSGTLWHLSDIYQQGFVVDEAGMSYQFHFKDVDGYNAQATRKELGLFLMRPVMFTPSHKNPMEARLYDRWAASIVILPKDVGIQAWLNVWRRTRDRWSC